MKSNFLFFSLGLLVISTVGYIGYIKFYKTPKTFSETKNIK